MCCFRQSCFVGFYYIRKCLLKMQSVSYGIVKDHGGDIRFETEIGVGTTMIVRLPINPPS